MRRVPANMKATRTHLEVTANDGLRMGSTTGLHCCTGAHRHARTLLGPGWRAQIVRLREVSMDTGSRRRWALGELGPPVWDTTPMAALLERASLGVGLPPSVSEKMRHLTEEQRGKQGIQRQAAQKMESALMPRSLARVAVRRMLSWWRMDYGAAPSNGAVVRLRFAAGGCAARPFFRSPIWSYAGGRPATASTWRKFLRAFLDVVTRCGKRLLTTWRLVRCVRN